MFKNRSWIAFETIVIREIRRFMRIWVQTLLPPAITMTLYFVIFGRLVGSRVGNMGGYDYMQFIVPGLVMMSIITNAYSNVVSSFFGIKFQRNIEELLVAPVSHLVILLGFVIGGVARGVIVGAIVTAVSLFFTHIEVVNWFVTISVVILTAILFSLAGFLNAVYAKTFDDISIVPTFVLTPLTYLGGVFYSISLLSPFWQWVSKVNPILYMVNAFRYGILGITDVSIGVSLGMIMFFIVVFFAWAMHMLNKGTGIRG